MTLKLSTYGILLQVFFMSVLFARTVNAQFSNTKDIVIHQNINGITVQEAFDLIEANTDFKLFYFKRYLKKGSRITLDAKSEKSVYNILMEISKQSGLKFRQVNNVISVSPISKNENNDEAYRVQILADVDISGKITDENGEGLPGASIVVKGSTYGTTTDIEGNYKLSVSEDATIVVSFVGYVTTEIVVGSQSVIDLQMEMDASQLDEVVVIGYGTQQRRDLTGSIVSADLSDKANAVNVNLLQAIQGALPGVNVGVGSAKAGQSPTISIRGQNSLEASSDPLIVIDGIIFNGALADININDVKALDVLKDASAAAVYGSRAANGVILITTKKGMTDKPQFNFNSYAGVQYVGGVPHANRMNAEQYARHKYDFAYQSGELYPWYRTLVDADGVFVPGSDLSGRPATPDYTNATLVAANQNSPEEGDNYLKGYGIDWLDETLRTAAIQSYDLSVSGKTNNTSYYISGSYVNQEGVTLNDEFERATLRANFENKPTNWLTLGLNSMYAALDYSGVDADLNFALVASPLASKFDGTGNFPTDLAGESYQRHPLSNTTADDLEKQNNAFFKLSAKVDIPFIKGLSYEINYANTHGIRRHFAYYPVRTNLGSAVNGRASKIHSFDKSWITNNIVSYSRIFNNNHNINATLLYSREGRNLESSVLTNSNFGISALGYNGIDLGLNPSVDSRQTEENSIAYMARVNYSFQNKYLVTGTIRRDGWSGFATNNKVATFPSVSLGWVASEEGFLSEVGWLDFLKTRVSYGVNGNQGITRFASFAKVTTSSYVFGSESVVTVRPDGLGNQDLKWETTKSLNFGIDFALKADRLSGSIDYYNSTTSDVLVQRSLPTATASTSIITNLGEVNNKGIEINLQTINMKKNDFEWTSSMSFSLNRNKLTKLFGGPQEEDFDEGNSWFAGEPINAIFGYENLGVIYTEEEFFSGEVPAGYFPGNWKVRDIITTDGNATFHPDDDRTILGFTTPNFRFSIGNSVSYKNFSLNVFINSIQGGGGYYLGSGFPTAGGGDYTKRTNQSAVNPYWTPENGVTNSSGAYSSQPISGTLLTERSFVRLQDVSLAYSFDTRLLDKFGLSNLRLYVSGKNLHVWTNWAGSWDPEVTGTVGVEGDDLAIGTSQTPLMRSVVVGINLGF